VSDKASAGEKSEGACHAQNMTAKKLEATSTLTTNRSIFVFIDTPPLLANLDTLFSRSFLLRLRKDESLW
jgi:hypothetical protein